MPDAPAPAQPAQPPHVAQNDEAWSPVVSSWCDVWHGVLHSSSESLWVMAPALSQKH